MANAAPFIDLSQSPYSCVPGTDCTAALQQAIDDTRSACISGGGNPNSAPCVFYFPGALTSNKVGVNPYVISKPILCDIGGITLKGDSKQTTLIRAFHGGDCLRFGYSRDGQGVSTHVLDSTYWPSNSGVLDGSQAATVGVRTKGTDIISWSGSGFDCGPSPTAPNFWSGVSQITVDLAVKINDGQGVTVCGLDSWFVNLSGEVQIFVVTPDGVSHRIHWTANTAPTGGSFTRISIQVDLNAGTANAWQDGVQLGNPVSGSSIPSGSTFLENGSVGGSNTGKFFVGQLTHDITVYGLKVTQGLLYTVSTTGSTQTRIDAATLNDQRRYFTVETTTCGLLRLTDGQNSYRYEQATGGTGESMYGFWWNSTLQNNNWSGEVSVRDLSIQSDFYGGAVSIAHILGLSIRDCIISGGMRGADSHAYFPSYPVTFRSSEISGLRDTAWYNYNQTLKLYDIKVNGYGRSAARVWGGIVWYGGFISGVGGTPEAVLKFLDGQNGSNTILDAINIDFEGSQSPTTYIDFTGSSNSNGAQLSLRNVGFGSLTSGAHVVLRNPTGPRGVYVCYNKGCSTPLGTPVIVSRADGAASLWRVIDVTQTRAVSL